LLVERIVVVEQLHSEPQTLEAMAEQRELSEPVQVETKQSP
jgi:hypothetical protein